MSLLLSQREADADNFGQSPHLPSKLTLELYHSFGETERTLHWLREGAVSTAAAVSWN